MTKVDLVNVTAVIATLLCSLALVPPWSPHTLMGTQSPTTAGEETPPRRFSRILSASVVADELLIELCEPDRIVGFTDFSKRYGRRAYRFLGKPTIESITDIEAVLTLNPDIVLLHSVGDPRPAQRLREAGIVVFDFGPVEGLSTLIPNIRTLAELLGYPARGERLIEDFMHSLTSVAADIPDAQRRQAMYAKVLGNQVFGGSIGSSFHDIIAYAGLTDIAAKDFERHPVYNREQLLTLDPELIIGNQGTRQSLCALPGLNRLRACLDKVGIIEIAADLLESAALGMVDAARAVRNAVYGPREDDFEQRADYSR